MATEVITPNHEVKFEHNVAIPGDFTPIPDAGHNPQIIALATWAIDEHNKDNIKLKLVKVFSAVKRVLHGRITYLITFEVAHVRVKLLNEIYHATVRESESSKELVSFTPAHI